MATTTAYCSCAVECVHAVRLLRAINYELVELRIDSSLQSGSGSCLRVVFRALRNALELVETIFKARAEAVKDIESVFGFVESSILRIEFLTISWLAGRQEVAYNVWLQQRVIEVPRNWFWNSTRSDASSAASFGASGPLPLLSR